MYLQPALRQTTFDVRQDLLTRTRALKYSVLNGFYHYAVSRGYATWSPLPDNEPKKPRPLPPHVYSRDEVRRLLDGLGRGKRASQLDADTMRTLILLLYGAGLRAGEARRLTLADVDLTAAVLTVRTARSSTRPGSFRSDRSSPTFSRATPAGAPPVRSRRDTTLRSWRTGTELR